MRVTVIDIEPAELAAIRQVLGLDVIQSLLVSISERQGQQMADFNALNAKIDEVATEITAAVERVGTDVDELKTTIATLELDADDQAKVDEAVAKLDGHVQALKAIDPVKVEDVPPTDEPTDPTEPVEPPTDPTA